MHHFLYDLHFTTWRRLNVTSLLPEAPQPDPSDLLPWARTFLPHHFTHPASAMHRWLADHAHAMQEHRGARVNLIGPRGHAKSTVITLAYVLRSAVEQTEPYIWIVSDTHSQAANHLENIKLELSDNQLLADVYPHATGEGPRWQRGGIESPHGVVIEAYGTGQKLRGRRRREHRPTLIVCDDVENEMHASSALQRERTRSWFDGTLLKAGTPETNVINLATALHADALALRLDRTPGWTSKVFRAIAQWPTNESFWQRWEAIYSNVDNSHATDDARQFYEEHRDQLHAGSEILWPEREDLYTLMRMRAESGRAAFDREKQGSPLDPSLCEWPEEYFGEDVWFDEWPRRLEVRTLALDPSKGSNSRRGDYSAYVMLGVDRHGCVYVEADLARRNTSQMVADGVELHRKFRPDAFGIEANQYQDLLAPSFDTAFREQSIVAARPWLLNNQVNKLVRIRRVGPYLASRRLRFKADSPTTRLLVDQLRTFPTADHDDGPDALEMALRLATEVARPCAMDDGLGDRLV